MPKRIQPKKRPVEPPTPPKKVMAPTWGFRCSDSFSITIQAIEKDLHYFKLWLADNQIYPLTNSMAAGPNFFSAAFSFDQKDKILTYLLEHGIPRHE